MKHRHEVALYDSDAIARKLQSHETLFSVTDGKISAIISEQELEELWSGEQTFYTKYSALTQDVSGLHTQFGEMTTNMGNIESAVATYEATVNGFRGDLSKVHDDYGVVESHYTSLSGSLEEISGQVTGISESLTDDYYTAEELDGMFSVKADEILQSVSRSYATTDSVAKTITSTVYEFAKSTSATVPPASDSSDWSTTSPTREEGKFIWMRMIRQYKDKSSDTTDPVCITGADGKQGAQGPKGDTGATGAQGPQGEKGDTGATGAKGAKGDTGAQGPKGADGTNGSDGVSITSATPQYYLSTSDEILEGGEWSNNPPTTSIGTKYVWTRTLFTWSEGSPTNSKPVLDSSLREVWQNLNNTISRVTKAEQKITDNAIIQTVTQSTAWTNLNNTVVKKGSVILAINDDAESSYTINVDRINLNGFISANGTFSISQAGTLTATGGTIGGWTLTAGKIYGGDSETGVAVMQKPGGASGNATWVFAAGGTSHSDYGDCKFKVSKNGDLYATGYGKISGWSFTQTKIFGGDSSTGVAVMQIPTANTNWVFAAGGTTHDSYASCPFRVSKAGILYAKGATFDAYGFKIVCGQAMLEFYNQQDNRYGYIFGDSLPAVNGGRGLQITGDGWLELRTNSLRTQSTTGSGYYEGKSQSFRVITGVSWKGSGIGYTYSILDFQNGLFVGRRA